jgi:hypothetical protein
VLQDLDPYIDAVIPGLKQSLLDPVPEVRSVSAHALGAMVKGMAGDKFDQLLKWLMDTLKSEGSSVDRSGAAQGGATVNSRDENFPRIQLFFSFRGKLILL